MKTAIEVADALNASRAALKPKGQTQNPKQNPARAPYSFTIGLDFGTAFSKCVIRDTRLSPSRAFLVAFPHAGESALLVPSEIYCTGDVLSSPLAPSHNSSTNTLPYLKMALYATVRGQRTDPWLLGISQYWPEDDESEIHRKVEALVIFYLASLLRFCFSELRKHRPDFGDHEGDLQSVNMAVPAAHAQDEAVEEVFLRCLNIAYQFANGRPDPTMAISDCISAIRKIKSSEDQYQCYLYPEVSANVQSFIKSPAGFPGLFLFVDVGAGTVDASTFIYHPDKENPKPLSYFAAAVMPLGSSQCEFRAVTEVAKLLHPQFRKCKEKAAHGDKVTIELGPVLRRVGASLKQELTDGVKRSVAEARKKIVPPRRKSLQWQRLRILTGGGGATDPLYLEATLTAFQPWSLQPEVLPLPLPNDLDWPSGVDASANLFRRFAVAYGLSFDRTTLENHRYPDETGSFPSDDGDAEPPEPPYSAPTKDEV